MVGEEATQSVSAEASVAEKVQEEVPKTQSSRSSGAGKSRSGSGKPGPGGSKKRVEGRSTRGEDSEDAEEQLETEKEHTDLLNGLVRVLNVSREITNGIVDRLSSVGPDIDTVDLTAPPPEGGYSIQGYLKQFSREEMEALKARRQILFKQLSAGGRGNFNNSWRDKDFLKLLSNNRIKDYQMAGVHWLQAMHDSFIDLKTKRTLKCPKGWESGSDLPPPEHPEGAPEPWPPLSGAGINGILADEMGLGKTAQTILFLYSLYHTGRLKKPTIVCCPASLMDNWVNELALWAPTLRVMKWHGNRNEKLRLLAEWQEARSKHAANEIHFFTDERILGYDDEATMQPEDLKLLDEDERWIKEQCHYLPMRKHEDNYKRCLGIEWMGRLLLGYEIIVTSHDAVRSAWDKSMFFKKAEFSYMVVDEAHALKNSSSQTYKALLSTVKAERRLLLTGSPVQNALNELLTLVAFLVPNELMNRENWEPAMALLNGMMKNEKALSIAKKKNDTAKIRELRAMYRVPLPKAIREIIDAQSLTPETPAPVAHPMRTGDDPAAPSTHYPVMDNLEPIDPSTVREAPPLSSATHVEAEDEPTKENEGFDTLLGALKTKKEKAGKTLRWDVVYLQTVLTPIILRRLKEETIKDLPPKINEIRPCVMTPSQEISYKSEISRARSSMGRVLQKLDSMRTGKKLPRASPSPSPGATGGSPAPSEGKKNDDFVKNLVARLRRITNHALLNVGRHKPEEYEQAKAYWIVDYSGKELNHPQAQEWVNKFSDFDWHMFASDVASEHGGKCPAKLRPMLLDDSAFIDSGKAVAFLAELDKVVAGGKKCLAFSQFVQYLDIVQEILNKHRPELKYLRIDGQVNASIRQGLVDEFNSNPEIKVILLSTRAAGQGYNLTAADTVFLLDQDWNPQVDRQAEDRVHRLGQTKPVTVMRFFCEGTIEEKILHTCQAKLDLDDAFGGNSELLSAALLEDALKGVEMQTEAEKEQVISKKSPQIRRRRSTRESGTPNSSQGGTPSKSSPGGPNTSTAKTGPGGASAANGSRKRATNDEGGSVKRRVKVRRVRRKDGTEERKEVASSEGGSTPKTE